MDFGDERGKGSHKPHIQPVKVPVYNLTRVTVQLRLRNPSGIHHKVETSSCNEFTDRSVAPVGTMRNPAPTLEPLP